MVFNIIGGVNVGTVKDMDIDRDKVIIGFDIGTNTIGTDSRALIKTDDPGLQGHRDRGQGHP